MNSSDNPISAFVQNLFDSLNNDGIQYAILRNYESLPEKPLDTDYFDLDLLVASKQLNFYMESVYRLAKKHNLKVIKKIEREYCKTIRVACISTDGHVTSVQLDSHLAGQNWWGFFYLTEAQILIDRSLYKSFFVVSDFHRHLFNWLDKLLFGNYVKEKYKAGILRVFNEHNQEFSSFLTKVFGKQLSAKLQDRFQSNDLEGTLLYRGKMINKLRKYSLLNFPLLTGISILKFYYYELRLYLFPPGICCLFDESSSYFIESSFRECKKVILGDQAILTYDGVSSFAWLKFYFLKVFPIVRKGGLAFIKVAKNSKFIANQNLKTKHLGSDLISEVLASNNTNILAGSGNLHITMVSD